MHSLSEIDPRSQATLSVHAAGERNGGRTAPLPSQSLILGLCLASSRPMAGIDTIPSYEKPSSTAEVMPSSMNDIWDGAGLN